MKPILDDEQSHEEYKKANSRKKKSKEEQELELIYNARCRVVSLSRHYPQMVDYIRKNQHILSKMDTVGKECMRRTCQDSLIKHSRAYVYADEQLFDSVFGPLIPINRSRTIFEDRTSVGVRDDTPQTLDEQAVAYTHTAYHTFYEWIADPSIQAQLSERPDLYYQVQKAIDTNRMYNFVMVSGKGDREYQPEDDILFQRVLDSMRD